MNLQLWPWLTRAAESKGGQLDFYKQVASLVAAVRTGVLEVEHAREPLAHVGRLGATYDAIARKLVDVLRDEGIYNRQADTIQHVAISALQSVSYLPARFLEMR
jgi:cohesin complex subunit SA-1/2